MKRFAFGLIQFIALAALSVGIFHISAELSARHNRFPTHWHPDEPGKARQILEVDPSEPRNFNHPQLMLEATLKLMEYEKTPRQTDAVIFAGRDTSAYLAAAAAVMLAWAGFFAARWPGFLLLGASATFCPALIGHAHYFKEDASLVCGMAAVICVAAAMSRRRHWSIMLLLALLMGAACGLAASGKYSGAVMLIPALLLTLYVTIGRWWIMPICPILLAAAAVGTWCLINYRAVDNWKEFREGFDRESAHSTEGHYGVRLPHWNTFFSRITWEEAMPHVKVLSVAAPFVLLTARRRRAPAAPLPASDIDASKRRRKRKRYRKLLQPPLLFGWWLMLALISYGVALSYSTIPFYRYAVPLTVMLYALAALAAAWIARAMASGFVHHALLTLIALAVIALPQSRRTEDYLNQFAHDSRDQLREWVKKEVPANTMIVADGYTDLRGRSAYPPELRTPANVMRETYAASMGSVDRLRSSGVQYVVIASSSFERFTDADTIGTAGNEREFVRYARFYRTLFEKCPIVMQWKAEHPMWSFSNPDIYVFKLADANRPQQPQPGRRPPRR